MNTKRNVIRTMLLSLLVVLLAAACAPRAEVTTLEGAERDAVLAFSEPMVDDLLAGLNAGDYAAFSANFDAAMAKAIPEKSFGGLQSSVTGKVGAYVSREVERVEKVGEFYRVVYKAQFEQDEAVQVLVSFDGAEPYQVAGLFFTSDKLK